MPLVVKANPDFASSKTYPVQSSTMALALLVTGLYRYFNTICMVLRKLSTYNHRFK